jgi:circadian clock protein KaiC
MAEPAPPEYPGLAKSRTYITGLDEITGGGLPSGRTSLLCGGPGCGKTLFAMEFLVRGALEQGEPGVFVAFEETPKELSENVASLGFDLNELVERGLLGIDYVHIERSEIEETGEYDLEGLFLRLGFAIDSIGARRVVLDTLEALFAGLPNEMILRAELRRLFRWLKDRGITAIVTAERGDRALTRHGLEEYVSDCVILLDHRIHNQISTRRLRVVKYRGSSHGTNEYPFIIDDDGISVLPITSAGLRHAASLERVSSGVQGLDEMMEGGGYFRGSSILISGTAGTGKTSLTAHFAEATCRRGERCLVLAFEESPRQLMRNMRSIGVDLAPHIESGLLRISASRPTLHGLETHLVTIHKMVREHRPAALIIDPISSLMNAGEVMDAEAVLTRLIDFLKEQQITTLFTSLTAGGEALERTEVGISSLMDTWLLVRMIESDGERNRGLYVLKSRGMAHSHQVREMRMTNRGVELVEVYLGTGGVLTGAARAAQENRDRAAGLERRQETERRQRELQRKRRIMEAQIAALRAQFEAEEEETRELVHQDSVREALVAEAHAAVAEIRQNPSPKGTSNGDA